MGVQLSKKLGYSTHLTIVTGKTAGALERILPNVGGSRQKNRKIIATAIQNQLLYASQIWAGALIHKRNINTILGPQRKIALRVAMDIGQCRLQL